MAPVTLQLKAPDGTAAAFFAPASGPHAAGKPRPGVLLFPDAFMLRPSIGEMVEHLAGHGYNVLAPNVVYRAGAYKPFDVKTAFQDPSERARLMGILKALDAGSFLRDLPSYLDALHAQPGVRPGPVGVVGYCLGGRLAVFAACASPENIAAAASIHGGGLVTTAPDSPHTQLSNATARFYFGIADHDDGCTPAQQETLRQALHVNHPRDVVELYPDAGHGFAVPDAGSYNKAAADKSWESVFALLDEAL